MTPYIYAEPPPASSPYSHFSLTILHSRGRRLCKIIRQDGTAQSYDNAKTFDLSTRTFSDLGELHAVLADLAERRDCCIVRGAIADPARPRNMRRLLHADGSDAPTLADAPRVWLSLDIDGMPLPDYITALSLFECAMATLNALPLPFRGAGCIAQASASFTRKPGAHLRLWFTLDRAITGDEAARWIVAIRKTAPWIDPASARPAQIIYTASPIFESGTDPIAQRLDIMHGSPVRVPPAAELSPPAPPPPKPPPPPERGGNRYAFAALLHASNKIASSPVGSRHTTIISEVTSLARFVASGSLTKSEISDALRIAARTAGKTDESEINSMIEWGFSHASVSHTVKGTQNVRN